MAAIESFTHAQVDAVGAIAKRASFMFDDPSLAILLLILVSEVHDQRPLRLQDFADADDFNFAHDVKGIVKHWNRRDKKMEDCFLPRFTA